MANNNKGKPTLHHLENSQSQPILWLLEELGIEYNLVIHERVKNRAPPALKEVHPLGKSPTLITPSGRVITERSAIAQWLISTYDEGARFRTPTPSLDINSNSEDDATREAQLLSLGSATLSPLLMLKLVLELAVRQAPFPARPIVAAVRLGINRAFLDGELALVVGHLEEQLAPKGEARDWFLGTEEPTRVDFSLLWYVDWAVQWGWFDIEKYPRLKEFRARCLARPAWKRGLEKGGNKYNLKFW
ncbi:hypothetical protein M426DRAFT_129185 [Hypoxylon sp. CI-4A]|nr:hypothetical protein M426DRAFT_129185 [Hypoxylon sp. CI-4A]